MSHKSLVHGSGESNSGIVPAKQPNQDGKPSAEAVEGRPLTKENTQQSNPCRTRSRERGSSGRERVRQAAKQDGKRKFTALLHPVNIDLLRESYYRLKRQAAPGVDGVRWEEYGRDLEVRLTDLHGRIHRGAYRAQPSRRVWIPKPEGRQRPLGIAALEDKIVQSADNGHSLGLYLSADKQGPPQIPRARTVRNQIWEEDFLDFSYGFRPGRGQYDALDALWVGIVRKRVNWILDLDTLAYVPYSILFRQTPARVAGPVCGTSDGRRAGGPPDPEMAEGGCDGRRTVERDEGRESTRIADLADTCQSLPALCLGCLGGGMAEEAGARRHPGCALCR